MPPAAQPTAPDPRPGHPHRVTRCWCSPARMPASRGTVQAWSSTPRAGRSRPRKFGAGWQRTSPLAGAAVVVDGINIAKRHTKPRSSAGRTDRQPRIQQGGILDIADAPQHQQRHDRLPLVLAAHPGPPHGGGRWPQRPGLRPLRRAPDARGEEAQVSELRQRYTRRGRARTPEGVRVRQRDAGAAPDQDRRQHRPG